MNMRVSACVSVDVIIISVQEARKAGNLPEDIYEVSAAASEAAAAWYPERTGVWL